MKSKFDRIIKRKMAASVLLLLPLIAACTQNGNNQQNAAVDPPPSDVENMMLGDSDGTAEDVSLNKDQLTVYLMDRNGYLAPMTLGVNLAGESPSEAAEQAIAWMTSDDKLKDQLPEGFTAILPAGLKADEVKVDDAKGAMTIDFAAPLPGMIAADERHMLEAIVWTMTELPGINQVKLTVAGQPLRSLPSSGMPVYDVLTRAIGINVEQAKGVDLNRSMAVTLYFSSQSASGEGYFVPVTRVIDRSADRARAALEQLIKGPSDGKTLQPVLKSAMTIEQLSQLADTVNVSLKDDSWQPNSDVSADMMEALVLTLTEATGAPQVRVVMNGDDSFLDSKDRNFDQPVLRPTVVNALKG
ncbi:GerMN domain-containing protein [Cohnella yongneupensis]|uniref:GerMN domain-containing protein n=1 Tax=Cohnella yongneupensis TaxID=425006 RepID=A0ABW0QWZ0_9BACL